MVEFLSFADVHGEIFFEGVAVVGRIPDQFDIVEEFFETFPQLATWPALAGYFGRIGAALRNGEPRVDLVVLDAPVTPHTYGTPDMDAALHVRSEEIPSRGPGVPDAIGTGGAMARRASVC